MDPTQHVNNWMKHNVADSQITTIGNLVPQKTYSVKVLAFTPIEMVLFSSDIQVITQTGGRSASERGAGEEVLVRRNGRGKNKE